MRINLSRTFAALTLVSTLPAALAYAATPKTKLTMDDAKKIALTKEAGTIKSGELEHEKGRWIYSFDVNATKRNQVREVNVDANTGQVVEDSLDTPADEAKEAAAEAKPHTAPQSR